jgi:hypothetical protein
MRASVRLRGAGAAGKVGAVLYGPVGKRLTAFLGEIVGRACGELDIDDATAAKLCAMPAATIDRLTGR